MYSLSPSLGYIGMDLCQVIASTVRSLCSWCFSVLKLIGLVSSIMLEIYSLNCLLFHSLLPILKCNIFLLFMYGKVYSIPSCRIGYIILIFCVSFLWDKLHLFPVQFTIRWILPLLMRLPDGFSVAEPHTAIVVFENCFLSLAVRVFCPDVEVCLVIRSSSKRNLHTEVVHSSFCEGAVMFVLTFADGNTNKCLNLFRSFLCPRPVWRSGWSSVPWIILVP